MWQDCLVQRCRPGRSGTSSTRCTPCTTRRAGPACGSLAREAGCSPHHGLDGVLVAAAPVLGCAGAAGRGDGRRRRASSAGCGWPRAVPGRDAPPGTADRGPQGRAGRRTPPPRGRHRAAAGHRRGRHRASPAWSTPRRARRPTIFVAIGCVPAPVDRRCRCCRSPTSCASIYESDDGQWITEALADCPPYVRGLAGRLLPELDQLATHRPAPDDDWWRQRLFSAVGTTLGALAALRPLAVLRRGPALGRRDHPRPARAPAEPRARAVPVVGTWRLDDPTVPSADPRLARRGYGGCRRWTTSRLGPLTRDETAEQLALLTGASRTRPRSTGSTGAAAVSRCSPSSWPPRPAMTSRCPTSSPTCSTGGSTVSATRRGRSPARSGSRTAPCTDALLREVTGLAPAELAAGLHELADRRLLRLDRGPRRRAAAPAARRGHPTTPGRPESVDEHRRIAAALARSADAVGRRGRRALAARRGPRRGDRLADPRCAVGRGEVRTGPGGRPVAPGARPVARAGDDTAGSPPVRKVEAYLAAMDALVNVDVATAWEVAQEGMRAVTDPTGADAAEIYQRAADIKGMMGDAEGGLVLADRAIDLHEPHRPLGRLRPCATPTRACCWTPLADMTRPGPPRQGPGGMRRRRRAPAPAGASSSSRPTATPPRVTWTAGWPASMPPLALR